MGAMTTDNGVDVSPMQESFSKMAALGQPQTNDQYLVEFDAYPDLNVLIRNFQIPEFSRMRIEDYAPLGRGMAYPGRPKFPVDMTATIVEVSGGNAHKALVEIVTKKVMLDLTITLQPDGEPMRFGDTFIETANAADLANEDNTTMKISCTFVCNNPWPWNEMAA